MATFVLVHGAFQGGWVWGGVRNTLRAQGHEVHTPTLTGCGHLHHGLDQAAGLSAYVQDVTAYLEFEDLSDAVLVAHSYSGMICCAVMMRAPERISRAVFVDAMIPDSNRSFADMAGDKFRQMLQANLGENGMVRPWPLPVFGVPEDKAAWFQPRLREFPMAGFTEPLPGEFDPSRKAAAFVACTQTMSPFIRAMADKARTLGWSVQEMESGHCPMVSHPELTTHKILAALPEAA